MILHTSALVCLVREEPDSARFVPALAAARVIRMSTANYLETAIVIDANDSRALSERLEGVFDYWGVELVAVTRHHSRLAREAYRTFGKGHHPAALNFGDCFAYALAMTTGEPLLFKGKSFSQTDVVSAA